MNTIMRDSSPSTSTSLLQQANLGDSNAWNRVVLLYGPIVYRWIRRLGFQPADCSDLMQETMTTVYRKLSSFDMNAAHSSFRGWLWTIARNKAFDAMRRNRLRPTRPLSPHAADDSKQASASEVDSLESNLDSGQPPVDAKYDRRTVLAAAIEMIRQRVDEVTWTAFWKTTVEDLKVDDVATELGISRWSVYKARSRVLQRLRLELAGLESIDDDQKLDL